MVLLVEVMETMQIQIMVTSSLEYLAVLVQEQVKTTTLVENLVVEELLYTLIRLVKMELVVDHLVVMVVTMVVGVLLEIRLEVDKEHLVQSDLYGQETLGTSPTMRRHIHDKYR